MKNISRAIFKWFIMMVILLPCFVGLRALYYASQARFNVDVLEKFIQMYREDQGEYPSSLENLVRINVVSYREGLSLDSQRLKKWQGGGYRYDYGLLEPNRFVLSASPSGAWPIGIEFGITEEGFLKFNINQVDSAADSYEDVKGWMAIVRTEQIVTRRVP